MASMNISFHCLFPFFRVCVSLGSSGVGHLCVSNFQSQLLFALGCSWALLTTD